MLFLLLPVMSVFLLVGCSSTNNSFQPLSSENADWWDTYLVLPISGLLTYFKELFGNYGWAILLVTLLVKIVLLPLTIKQQKSMKAMQKIQPQLQKIREKYKKDPRKLQEEYSKLMREHNVSPLGCLTTIMQLPILIALYSAVRRTPEIACSHFFYLELGQPDPYYILPILAAVTTWFQAASMQTGDNNPQRKIMLWVMPIMILYISSSFSAAIALYWIFSNLLGILQNYFIKKMQDENGDNGKPLIPHYTSKG